MKKEFTESLQPIWELFPLRRHANRNVIQKGLTGELLMRQDVAAESKMATVGGIPTR